MFKKIITAAPDYLSLKTREFFKHYINTFTKKEYSLSFQDGKNTVIFGFSCRALFETILKYLDKDDLTVLTPPLHHTSFRNIIEKYAKPENIHIIKFNENYNGLKENPAVEKCDLVVITHLFGQDLDLSQLEELKKKHNCLIIEDRVQGGTLDIKYSSDVVDISIYSMGMDKKPIALGGGFMYVRNHHDDLINETLKITKSLPKEKPRKRRKDIRKKIPTFLFYNSKICSFFIINFLNALSFFTKKNTLLDFINFYRKKRPGFSHINYMLKPSKGLLKSMYEKFNDYKEMEQLYEEKYNLFINNFSHHIISEFFPFYKGKACLTPYNTIILDENDTKNFLDFLTKQKIACIANPTYKLFNFDYKNKSKDKSFNKGIVYLPSVANMNRKEIDLLTKKIYTFVKDL